MLVVALDLLCPTIFIYTTIVMWSDIRTILYQIVVLDELP